jgi:hypothetical protein
MAEGASMLGRAVKRLAVAYLRRNPGARRHLLYLLREGYPGLPVISQSEYPVDSYPRYGYGRPAHPQLLERIESGRARYAERLRGFLALKEQLARIPKASSRDPARPAWMDPYLPGLDLVALYGLLAQENPRRYVEVGSGKSTKTARLAIGDCGLRTRIISIDPNPRAEVDALCDEVVRQRLEDADLARFDELESGDVLFIDNSHRVFMNSDATVMFLDVLPRLKPGVIVEIHDVFLPYDYPTEWKERYYSEQYLLAAYLLGGAPVEILLPNLFVHRDPELNRILDPLWDDPRLDDGVQRVLPFLDWLRGGCSFWMRVG